MIRGQIWEYTQGSQQYRVLIVSSDEYNDQPGMPPCGLTVTRQPHPAVSLVVPLGVEDPLSGAVVLIPHLLRIDRSALRHNLGHVSNDTMNAVEYGLREFFVLP